MSNTVLVVDDDPEFLREITVLLNGSGYMTVTARDGKEALTKLADPDIVVDVAIIDLAMPEVGGFQVIGELGKVERRPIPLLAVTGAYSNLYLEVAKYLGAHESIRKPLSGQPLTPIIEALNRIVANAEEELR